MEEELAPAHGAAHRGPVEHVRLDGLGLEGGEPLEPPLVAEGDPDLVVASISSRTMWPPTNPVPPVTQTFMGEPTLPIQS